MDPSNNSFVPGELLSGRFRTVAPLNHGSFGIVFLATDIQSGQDVAIKRLAKASAADPASPAGPDYRLVELDCHRRLAHHPNLVNLVHSFETDEHLYLVLEYCPNGDLYEAIRLNRGPLETEHVRDFMLQLIGAVEFMHANAFYHRDIKPENIFLMQDGSMKLGDFGLVTRDAWSHEACVGSDRYMAPEQYDPAATGYAPAQADVWAVGVCLLNVLFARNPFATPTESDVLFADYVRDRQSLFDIFTNMSQDTFEVLRHALALDPSKRSLAGMRDAILRVVSFTTDDEALDEFCTDDREIVVPATANREPLRTPSLQSPFVNQGDSFPWAKALQSSPPPSDLARPLSVIPDDAYSEDLFPPSETAGTSWFSNRQATPSMASVLESALGESAPAARPVQSRFPPPSDPVPITGSLPAHKPLPSLSMVFGRHQQDQISKSWSDLWDEEEEALSEPEDSVLQQRRAQNARSWSQESGSVDGSASPSSARPVRPATTAAVATATTVPPRPDTPPTAADPAPAEKSSPAASGVSSVTFHVAPRTPPRSPKTSPLDKWAALGDKRRNYKPSTPPAANPMAWRRDWGLGSSGFDYGTWAKKDHHLPSPGRHRRPFLAKGWRRDSPETLQPVADPWASPTYDGSVDEDLDLVGGWHDLHL